MSASKISVASLDMVAYETANNDVSAMNNRYNQSTFGSKGTVTFRLRTDKDGNTLTNETINPKEGQTFEPFKAISLLITCIGTEIRKTGKDLKSPKGEPVNGVQRYNYTLAAGMWVDHTNVPFENAALTGQNYLTWFATFKTARANFEKSLNDSPKVKTAAIVDNKGKETSPAVHYTIADYEAVSTAKFDASNGAMSGLVIKFELI
jgi:hypothetical protein